MLDCSAEVGFAGDLLLGAWRGIGAEDDEDGPASAEVSTFTAKISSSALTTFLFFDARPPAAALLRLRFPLPAEEADAASLELESRKCFLRFSLNSSSNLAANTISTSLGRLGAGVVAAG